MALSGLMFWVFVVILSLGSGIISIIRWEKTQKKIQAEIVEYGSEVSSFYGEMKKYQMRSTIFGLVGIFLAFVILALMSLVKEGGILQNILIFFEVIFFAFAVVFLLRGALLRFYMKTPQKVKVYFDKYKAKGITLGDTHNKCIFLVVAVIVLALVFLLVRGCDTLFGSSNGGPCSACGGDGVFFGEVCDLCGGWG